MKGNNRNSKLLQVIFASFLIILTLYFAFDVYTGLTYAVELNAGDSELTIDQKQLFNLAKLYPGQPPSEARQPLKIKNTGESDFQFSISSEFGGGDPRLFDILKLNIVDNEGIEVYSGNLKNLNDQALGTIRPGSSKTFNFTLELPEVVDNSYQALNTSFQFNIAASGDSSTGPSMDSGSKNDDRLPNTGVPSHIPYYSAGFIALIGGLFLWKKKQG